MGYKIFTYTIFFSSNLTSKIFLRLFTILINNFFDQTVQVFPRKYSEYRPKAKSIKENEQSSKSTLQSLNCSSLPTR